LATKYAIAGGLAGKERLDVLHRVHGPATCELLDSIGVKRGARCLDAGCGGGHVSRELARRVGETGAVVGIDLDDVVLELARSDALAADTTNVEFRTSDASDLEMSGFDLVFARFLLSHVDDAATVVRALVRALKPGGMMVVEDTDISVGQCAIRGQSRSTDSSSSTARPSEAAAATPTLVAGFPRCSPVRDSSMLESRSLSRSLRTVK
jgi:ubiquinone/menaquinone biosynthesis C-methylase UbiE